MSIRLERLQSTPYSVTYFQPNGNEITYTWAGAKDYARSIVEVDEAVYQWLKYNTLCFQNKKLVIVDEDMKDDIEVLFTEEDDRKVYTLQEVKALLNGSLKDLKAELENMSEDNVMEFINVARQMKLDSSSKRNALAKKVKLPTEIVFDEE